MNRDLEATAYIRQHYAVYQRLKREWSRCEWTATELSRSDVDALCELATAELASAGIVPPATEAQ